MSIIEPVTSQYARIYWARWLFFPILIIGCIYIVCTNFVLFPRNPIPPNQNLVVNLVLSVLSIVFYKVLFIRSFPKKVVVTAENVTIAEYGFTKIKHLIINYTDIKDSKTYRQQADVGDISGQTIMRPETLNIELYNGQSYEISENDFENYNNLKSAIYDHLFRHK